MRNPTHVLLAVLAGCSLARPAKPADGNPPAESDDDTEVADASDVPDSPDPDTPGDTDANLPTGCKVKVRALVGQSTPGSETQIRFSASNNLDRCPLDLPHGVCWPVSAEAAFVRLGSLHSDPIRRVRTLEGPWLPVSLVLSSPDDLGDYSGTVVVPQDMAPGTYAVLLRAQPTVWPSLWGPEWSPCYVEPVADLTPEEIAAWSAVIADPTVASPSPDYDWQTMILVEVVAPTP